MLGAFMLALSVLHGNSRQARVASKSAQEPASKRTRRSRRKRKRRPSTADAAPPRRKRRKPSSKGSALASDAMSLLSRLQMVTSAPGSKPTKPKPKRKRKTAKPKRKLKMPSARALAAAAALAQGILDRKKRNRKKAAKKRRTAPKPATQPRKRTKKRVGTRRQRKAAEALYRYVTVVETRPRRWGFRRRPNATIAAAQGDMGQLTADGIYGPATRARGLQLIGKRFPVRRSD